MGKKKLLGFSKFEIGKNEPLQAILETDMSELRYTKNFSKEELPPQAQSDAIKDEPWHEILDANSTSSEQQEL